MAFMVVFGAGQVGSGLARALSEEGHRVRVVRRRDAPVAGAEVAAGDARDPAFVVEATRGADVIFHCMNPSAYTAVAWEAEFPLLGEALIAGAKASGAKLVCLDNLYAYGVAEVRTEASAPAADGPKGRLRAAWEARLRREPGLRWVLARAGDFFGPGAGEHALMSPSMVAGLAAGKAAWLVGATDAVHAFSFVPDVVTGLAALGSSDEEGVWHLPVIEVAPRELVARLGAVAGRSGRSYAVPAWGVRALGAVVPLFRELGETLYQWDRPFRVSDARFRARFPGLATSLEDAARRTVEASTLATKAA